MKTPNQWAIQFERLNTSKSPYFSLEDLISDILLDGMKEGARRAADMFPERKIKQITENWTEKDLNY